jgi:ABC-type amino acid transport substrate-binding protein
MNSKRMLTALLIGALGVAGCTSASSSTAPGSATGLANPPTPSVSTFPSTPAASAAASEIPSSNAAAAAGCPIATPPAGSTTTSISTWVDPRPCDWAQTYPEFASAPVGDGSLQRIQSKGAITVCAETDVRPVVYLDPTTGTVTGFEPEILLELTKRLGIAKTTYVNIPFVSYIPALQAHKCDLVMGGIVVTGERAKAPGIRYAFPYFRYAEVIVVRADSPYQKVDDLKGKKFASLAGSIEDKTTKQIISTLGGGTSVQEYTAIANVILAVLNGTDQAFIDPAVLLKLHPNADKLRALPGLLGGPTDPASPYYPGSGAPITAGTDGDLNAAIAVGIDSMIQDGTLEQILTKWAVFQPGTTDFIRPDA